MSAAYDVAVIGGGPAGMACATTAVSLGLRTVLFERMALGGELATLGEVTELPGRRGVTGPDLCADLMEEVLDSGVEVEYVEVDTLVHDGTSWTVNTSTSASAVVLATGLEPDLDRLPGARERAGRGVSSCSSCDGPLFKGKRVAVVGDGEHAARMALEVGAFASAVTVVADGELRVSAPTRQRLEQQPGLELRTGTTVAGFKGTPVDQLLVRGPEGALELDVEGVFVGLPRIAHTGLVEQVSHVVDGRCETGPDLVVRGDRPLALAVGDVRAGASDTVAGAIGDGVAAGWAVARALTGAVV